MKHFEPEEDRQIGLIRVIHHPIEKVWEVWTNPDHLRNWWGPHGFTSTITKMDMRAGGEWHLTMHGPDGTDYRNASVFVEVIPHHLIVYDHLTGPKFRGIVLFQDLGGKTQIDWRMVFETREIMLGTLEVFNAQEGQKDNFVRMEEYLSHM
jgi:uncharacterized protein YndB with AHSA1/START domain